MRREPRIAPARCAARNKDELRPGLRRKQKIEQTLSIHRLAAFHSEPLSHFKNHFQFGGGLCSLVLAGVKYPSFKMEWEICGGEKQKTADVTLRPLSYVCQLPKNGATSAQKKRVVESLGDKRLTAGNQPTASSIPTYHEGRRSVLPLNPKPSALFRAGPGWH